MIKYVYICSAGHSGSTLLDLLLGSHSRMFSLGEISHLPKNISLNTLCACGHPVRSCRLWSKVISILNKNLGYDLYKDPYAFDLGFINPVVIKDKIHKSYQYKIRRRLFTGFNYLKLKLNMPVLRHVLFPINQAISNNFCLYDIVRQVTNKSIVIDSTKIYQKGLDLYLEKPDEVRIILLSRDGRGFLYSNLKRNLFNREKSVYRWMRYYDRTLPFLKKYVQGKHMIHIKYEDLATDPAAQLNRVCSFLGIDFEESMLDFACHEHHITNGNDMRFQRSSEIRPDFAWKEKLSPCDLCYFEQTAGSLNCLLDHET
jgi:hypothetical protein